MKKIVTILVLVMLASAVQAQQHEKVKELEQFLTRHGFVLYSKTLKGGLPHHSNAYTNGYRVRIPVPTETMNDEEERQQRRELDSINAIQRMEQEAIWDSIRTFVCELMPHASQCYLHESHKDGRDTIKYSLICYEDDHNHRDQIFLRYFQGLGKEGHYYGVYSDFAWDYGLETGYEDDIKAFDIDGFETYLKKTLAPILKMRGTKQYPIHWEYDKDYPIREKNKETYLYWNVEGPSRIRTKHGDEWVEELVGGCPEQGTIIGTDYFIPKSLIDSTFAFLRGIETEIVAYLEQHLDQRFTHRSQHGFSEGPNGIPIWDFSPLHEFVSSEYDMMSSEGTAYILFAYTNDEGVHLLSLRYPEHALWIPKGFEKMKRWVNGKATYRK